MATAACAGLVFGGHSREQRDNGGLSSLLGDRRPFEARLTGSRRWRPCLSDTAALRSREGVGCANYVADPTTIGLALRALGEDSAQGRSNAHAWNSNLLDLAAAGRAEQLDDIVERFSDLRPTSGADLNDAAVAQLARGAARHDPWSVIEALETIERALDADSTSRVIRFNHALILEQVGLNDGATAAWHEYARGEPDSAWALEAVQHVRRLDARRLRPAFKASAMVSSRSVDEDPQGAREFVTDSLLGEWARAVEERTGTDKASIALMRTIGVAIAARSGDSSVIHLASSCESATADVARSVTLHARGASVFRRGAYAAAKADLTTASRELRHRGASVFADWNDILVAAISMFEGGFTDGERVAERVARSAAQRGDVALRARAYWVLGLIAARQERAEAAERHTMAAERLFASIGESGNEAFMRAQLADVDYSLGRDDAWLTEKTAALSQLDGDRDVRRRYSLVADLGKQLADIGHERAGIAILREAVILAEHTGRPSDRAEALVRLAAAQFASGRERVGLADLASARRSLDGISDSLMHARVDMEVSVAAARFAARQDPPEAARYLSRVIDYFESQGLRYSIALPLTERANARLQLRDTIGAVADLNDAISLTAEDLGGAIRATDRDGAAARSEAFRLLTAIDAAQGDTVGALRIVERARGAGAAHSVLAQRGTVGITYATLDDESLLWIATSNRVRMVRLPITKSRISDLVAQFEGQVNRHFDEAATRHTARVLYDLLIGPADRELTVSTGSAEETPDLVLSTDGPLARLPFAVLRDSVGRFLFEKAILRYASVVESRRPGAVDRRSVVVVSNPSFDQALFPDLASLPGAQAEGPGVARAYQSARLVVNAAASKPAILDALRGATLFHFAGHARLVDRAPRLSHLVAAASRDGYEANVISAAEISRLNLTHLSLAVLSSCGTAQRHSRLDLARDGLAQALLNAGTAAVISSIWAVDDDAVAPFMALLHEKLAGGTSPASALRDAQLELLKGAGSGRGLGVAGVFRVETN